jgi:hypothetical protein
LRGATTEADVGDHLVRFQQGHVFEEQTDHALALTLRGSGVTPEAREVHDQCHYLLTLLHVQRAAFGAMVAFVVILGRGEHTQLGVPFRFERIGDQAVVGIDAEVAPLGKLSGVAGTIHLLASHPVHLLSTVLQLVLQARATSMANGLTVSTNRSPMVRSRAPPTIRWQGPCAWSMPSRWQTYSGSTSLWLT